MLGHPGCQALAKREDQGTFVHGGRLPYAQQLLEGGVCHITPCLRPPIGQESLSSNVHGGGNVDGDQLGMVISSDAAGVYAFSPGEVARCVDNRRARL